MRNCLSNRVLNSTALSPERKKAKTGTTKRIPKKSREPLKKVRKDNLLIKTVDKTAIPKKDKRIATSLFRRNKHIPITKSATSIKRKKAFSKGARNVKNSSVTNPQHIAPQKRTRKVR